MILHPAHINASYLYVYENGVRKLAYRSYIVGDILRVEREGINTDTPSSNVEIKAGGAAQRAFSISNGGARNFQITGDGAIGFLLEHA